MYIAKATQIRNWSRFTLQDINSQVLQKMFAGYEYFNCRLIN
jgi:hypothetical protein